MATEPVSFKLIAQSDKAICEEECSGYPRVANHSIASQVRLSPNTKHFFIGQSSFPCSIQLWHRQGCKLKNVGTLGPMTSGLAHFDIDLMEELFDATQSTRTWVYCLAVITLCGWTYLWTVTFQERVSLSEPQVSFTLRQCIKACENPSGPSSLVGFLGDHKTLVRSSIQVCKQILVGCLPFQNLCLLDAVTGRFLALIPPLSHPLSNETKKEAKEGHEMKNLAIYHYTCMAIDPIASIFPQGPTGEIGRWVALGDAESMLVSLFFSESLLDSLQPYEEPITLTDQQVYRRTALLCSARIKTVDIVFRPHSPKTRHLPKVSCLFSDGWIRHWTMENQRLKVALSEPDMCRQGFFLRYGPLVEKPETRGYVISCPVLVIASNRQHTLLPESLLTSLTPSSYHPTRVSFHDPYALLCWSVSINSGYTQRHQHILHTFSFPITGLACCIKNSIFLVVTQDNSSFMFYAEPAQGLNDLVENDMKRLEVFVEGESVTFDILLKELSQKIPEKCRDLIQEFENPTIKNGILVLINDCDWELHGCMKAVLKQDDVVTFISTLHGG